MADEVYSVAALSQDRGLPLGNSPGSDGRRALHVRPSSGQFITEVFDGIDATYPASDTEVYAYSLQGSPVATLTVVYTNASKNFISSVVKS